MATLVRFSIRFAGVIIIWWLLVALYGVYCLKHSKLNVFPEFSPKQTVIQTEAVGFSSELVEKLVTQPIENSLAGTAGIVSMRSQSIPGLSIVTLIFDEDSDIYHNRQLIAERLVTLNHRLPTGVVPILTPLTSSASTLLGLGLTSTQRSLVELRTLVDTVVVPHLLTVRGVADVNVFGGRVRQIQLQIVPDKLVLYGVSLLQVEEALKQASGVRGNGFFETQNQRIAVQTEGQFFDTKELAQMPLLRQNGYTITLGDIGTFVETAAPSISSASINGKTGVYLSVQGQLDANSHEVTLAVEQAMQTLLPSLKAHGVTLHSNLFRPSNFIDVAIHGVRTDIMIGSILVIAVLFIFLFNLRTAFISAISIPLSLLTAIIVMYQLGSGINIMVLGGLAIALGEVVDDAIIDTEKIFSRLRENRLSATPLPAQQVVFSASMEVRSSVVYATWVVALVFVPLLTLSGVAGKLFAPLGITYIAAILASLLVALTLTPALCYTLLAHHHLPASDSSLIHWLKQHYTRWLRHIEKRYLLVLGVSFTLMGIGLALLPLFKTQFIPPLHEGHYIMHMTAISGTSEQESLRIGNQVSARIRQISGVKSVTQWVGRAQNGADTFGTHYSEFEIELGKASRQAQERILQELRTVLGTQTGGQQHEFLGVNFAINTFLTERIEETISGYSAALAVNLYGNDLYALDQDAVRVVYALQQIRSLRDVWLQSPTSTPNFTVRLLPDKLKLWGVPANHVLDTIRLAYQNFPVTHLFENNHVVGISVGLATHNTPPLSQLAQLPLRSLDGKILYVRDVAEVYAHNGRAKILHSNGQRTQTITANFVGDDIAVAHQTVKNTLKNLPLSANTHYEISGEAQENAQFRSKLVSQSLMIFALVCLMLFIVFRSWRHLMLTLANLPFALIGGVFAVIWSGGVISLGSLVGFVTLFGITLRNTIMLVSHYQHLITVEHCVWGTETAIRGAKERLPSILMTALVTALGLLPLALGSGEPGRELEGPMATIILGGLITSTLLNLLILPTLFLHFGKFNSSHLDKI